jgi:hypothetical protein
VQATANDGAIRAEMYAIGGIVRHIRVLVKYYSRIVFLFFSSVCCGLSRLLIRRAVLHRCLDDRLSILKSRSLLDPIKRN